MCRIRSAHAVLYTPFVGVTEAALGLYSATCKRLQKRILNLKSEDNFKTKLTNTKCIEIYIIDYTRANSTAKTYKTHGTSLRA